jgi:Na+/H+ antiporter NhaD/arsenite permease-like protein
MGKITAFIRREAVLVVAWVLAAASMFFVPPDGAYLGYVDLRTLAILFCLMTVVAGFRALGVFEWLSQKLLDRAKNMRQLTLALVLLCFFSSMVITNDVALITFVPFTFILLELAGEDQERSWLIPIVVMQTVAANLGSMLTPLGNPQNLYLYGKAEMSLGGFLSLMLPYTAASLVLLLIWVLVRGSAGNAGVSVSFSSPARVQGGALLGMYGALFALSLLAVLRILNYGVVFGAVLICALVADRKVLKSVDYSLLLTFVGFFVFVGNMGRVPEFRTILESAVSGHETVTAILASQVISNVPTALLLSEFSGDIPALIVGTDLGGLGTLIASMASLISYKLYAQKNSRGKGRYLLYFTAANVVFLLALLGVRWMVNR